MFHVDVLGLAPRSCSSEQKKNEREQVEEKMRAGTLVKVSDKALVLTGRSGVARDRILAWQWHGAD